MKEKIKIICLVLVTIGSLFLIWVYVQKGIIYLNAYKDCMKFVDESWKCVGVLNGRSY